MFPGVRDPDPPCSPQSAGAEAAISGAAKRARRRARAAAKGAGAWVPVVEEREPIAGRRDRMRHRQGEGRTRRVYETIRFEAEQGIGVLTLNRPRVLNAISRAMVEEIMDVQSRVESDPAVNVLVLTGAGRSFCAGYDLKEADAGEDSASASDLVDARRRLERCCDMTMGFWHCRKPKIGRAHV